MELALAGAGAAVGGWAFGGTGAAVGWMVGSWIFGLISDNQDDANQVPPAAQPFLNSVQRGDTMPVFFGTNKVPSQNTWQANFNAIRQDSPGAAGGKMGGSGGGKGGKVQQNSNAGYTYKWDLIYHLGMVPEPYSLFGGWLGTTRINPQIIASITQKFSGPPPFVNPTVVTTGNASIQYDEAVYFPGDNPSSGSWTYLDGIIGQHVTFPSTAWLGFKQLVLGSSPSVPQLFWEIGPGGATFNFNPDFFAVTANAYNGISTTNSGGYRGLSQSGHLIWVGPDNVAYGFDPQTMAVSWTVDPSVDCAQVALRFNLTPVSGIGNGPTGGFILGVVQGGNYMIVGFTGSSGGYATIPFQQDIYFGLYDISTATPTLVSIIGAATGDFVDQFPGIAQGRSLEVSNNQTDDDCIIYCKTRSPIAGQFWEFVLFPSINGFKAMDGRFWSNLSTGTNVQGRSYPGLTNSDLPKFNASAYICQEMGGIPTTNPDQTGSDQGWAVPKATVGMSGVTYGTLFQFYITRGMMQYAIAHGSLNGWVGANCSTYPNGAMIQLDLGTITQYGSGGLWATAFADIATLAASFSDYEVINSEFVDTSGAPVFPFSDANKHRDGTASTLADYRSQPFIEKITTGEAAGAYVLSFTMAFRDAVDKGSTGQYLYTRIFLWNPITETYTQLEYASGAVLDTVTDLSQAEGHRYDVNYTDNYVYYNPVDGNVYWMAQVSTAGNPNHDHILNARLGRLSISGGADVTPPYIIYQILVNSIFGLGSAAGIAGRITAANIDTDSYQAAVQYCTANSILVSTQYRNPSDFTSLVELLLAVYGGYLIVSNGKIKFGIIVDGNQTGGQSVRTLDNSHLVVEKLGDDPVQIARGALPDTYNKVKVNFIDRTIDYNQNYVVEDEETDQDITGIRQKEFPGQFVMSEATARTMAIRTLYNNLYARDTYNFKLSWKDADLEPGDIITLVDSYYARVNSVVLNQKAMITSWKENKKGQFDVTATQLIDSYLTSSSSPLNVSSPSQIGVLGTPAPPKAMTAFELPQEYQGANPYVFVAWVPPPGAAGATPYVSPDGVSYAPGASVTPYPLTGRLLTNLPGDLHMAFTEGVDLVLFPSSNWNATSGGYDINATLPDIAADGIGLNAGVLWCGSEAMAYTGLTLVGQNWYKARRLYRGWGGTHIHDHSSGDFWYKLGGGIAAAAYNINQIGTRLYIKMAPFDLSGIEYNVASITPITYTIQGAYYRPQNAGPLSVYSGGGNYGYQTKVNVGGTGNVSLAWDDSARQSGYGAGGYGSIPGDYGGFTTDVLSHNWRVEVVGSDGLVVRSTVVTSTFFTYSTGNNASDNGAWRGNVAIKVTPFSPYGDAPMTSVISLELF